MSSSSPPQPQKEFEKPFTVLNCSTVIAETPPKMPLYGSLFDDSIQNKCHISVYLKCK